MFRIETATTTRAYRQACEDRVAVFTREERTVIAVADGAGGMGSGDAAAESVIREVEAACDDVGSADDWCAILRQADCRVGVGQTTAVVVDIRPYGIAGASVGDSQAWLVFDGDITNLTQNQIRKPLLGSGGAIPVSFVHQPLKGRLVVGTDGFFNYVKREQFTAMVSQTEFYSIPHKCVELVQLPSGDLWDDIGIVVAQVQRAQGKTVYRLD